MPQILQGDISQVSIWGRALAASEVRGAASCEDPARGSVFSSDSAEFEEFGVEVRAVDVQDLCRYCASAIVISQNGEDGMEKSHKIVYLYALEF